MAKSLNNEQKQKVQELILKKKSVEEIIDETGYNKNLVEDYLNKLLAGLQKVEEEKEKAANQKKRVGPRAIDLMPKETAAKKQKRSVMVMTPNASQVLDEARKNLPANTETSTNRKLKDCIHKIKE